MARPFTDISEYCSTHQKIGSSLFSVDNLVGKFGAVYSAALRLFKGEADINGILPAERAPAIYFVSPLSRLRFALEEVTVFCV